MTDEGKESKSFGGSSYRNSPILCPKRLPPTGSSKHIVSGKKNSVNIIAGWNLKNQLVL